MDRGGAGISIFPDQNDQNDQKNQTDQNDQNDQNTTQDLVLPDGPDHQMIERTKITGLLEPHSGTRCFAMFPCISDQI